VAKPMGAVSAFTNGELHPSTTVKAAFRDISTTRFTLKAVCKTSHIECSGMKAE